MKYSKEDKNAQVKLKHEDEYYIQENA